MLPDYPDAKNRARRLLIKLMQEQVPQHEPLLAGIKHSRVHEGRSAVLTRQDKSIDDIEFRSAGAEVSLTREQMRRGTVDELLEHVSSMAAQLAGQQVQLMFEKVSKAVEEVGNVVSASELGTKEAFLEMQRKLEVDFDPETLEPKNLVIVLHPSQVQSFKAQAEEWEKDPTFVAEMNQIREQQIEAWRARENSRKLVD